MSLDQHFFLRGSLGIDLAEDGEGADSTEKDGGNAYSDENGFAGDHIASDFR